jgi:hypothetical protein
VEQIPGSSSTGGLVFVQIVSSLSGLRLDDSEGGPGRKLGTYFLVLVDEPNVRIGAKDENVRRPAKVEHAQLVTSFDILTS